MNQKLKKLWNLSLPYLNKANLDRANHTFRVLKFAESLAKKENADLEVVQFAAILHDVGKYKENELESHSKISAKIAPNILKELKLSEEKKKNIIHCIEVHSLDDNGKAKTIEAKVIQDADRLDRMSSVRIALYLYFAEQKKRSLLYSIEKAKKAIMEEQGFNTKTGKEMAAERKKESLDFINRIQSDFVEVPK